MAIPLLIKLGALGVAGWLAFKKKPPATKDSGLPQSPQGEGGKDPVVGLRWTLWNVDLVSMVSETDDRWEGFYSSTTGELVAVVDGNTFDANRTSAVVVNRNLAPDLPDVWE